LKITLLFLFEQFLGENAQISQNLSHLLPKYLKNIKMLRYFLGHFLIKKF
jgi:hypothetical protein